MWVCHVGVGVLCGRVCVQYLELTGGLVQYGFIQLDGLTFDHPTEDMAGMCVCA